MTATSLGLNGEPVKFLGAYIKSASSNLGMSVNPSTMSVTLAEDDDAQFIRPEIGTFHTVAIGPAWEFSGIITRYEIDLAQTGGRLIRVNISDPREMMKSIPTILAPGYTAVVDGLNDTSCSLLNIFGAFNTGGINLSNWNQSGMEWNKIVSALHGENVLFGETIVPIQQQFASIFGETYRIDVSNLVNKVAPDYRINTNLVPISTIIEDVSTKHSFDWYVTSSRAADEIIDVVIHTIDRSTDNVDIGLKEFLETRIDRVVTATSGVELRNELSCLAMQGAPVEQFRRVEIKGLANEPIDLTAESGSNKYVMTETEIRVVLGGKNPWEFWLASPTDLGGGGGYSRYGGVLEDDHIQPIMSPTGAYAAMSKGGLPSNDLRDDIYLRSLEYANAGRLFEKLKGKSENTYGKRWVHDDILDDIIDTAWTRDVAAGDNDPYEYFRQDDGRTRAFLQFTSEPEGGAFSLGLADLTNLFGDQNIFRNVTRFGTTFENLIDVNGAILACELTSFNPVDHSIKMDKSNYTYNDVAAINDPLNLAPTVKTSLYVAATLDKDGVIKIDAPIFESKPDIHKILNLIVRTNLAAEAAKAKTSVGVSELVKQIAALNAEIREFDARSIELIEAGPLGQEYDDVQDQVAEAQDKIEKLEKEIDRLNKRLDADGIEAKRSAKIKNILVGYFGGSIYGISARCFQPDFAFIPTRSRHTRYGPVFSSNLSEATQGKLEIIQDDGYAPWEFGSVGLMIDSMQLKVDNATSTVKEVFSANLSVEGYPELNLGDSLEKNSNITSMSVSFGDGGVKTQYSLQTFTRKFGELSKEDWARISLFLNGSAERILPQQQIGFNQNHRFGVNKKINGAGDAGAGTVTGGSSSFG